MSPPPPEPEERPRRRVGANPRATIPCACPRPPLRPWPRPHEAVAPGASGVGRGVGHEGGLGVRTPRVRREAHAPAGTRRSANPAELAQKECASPATNAMGQWLMVSRSSAVGGSPQAEARKPNPSSESVIGWSWCAPATMRRTSAGEPAVGEVHGTSCQREMGKMHVRVPQAGRTTAPSASTVAAPERRWEGVMDEISPLLISMSISSAGVGSRPATALARVIVRSMIRVLQPGEVAAWVGRGDTTLRSRNDIMPLIGHAAIRRHL